MALQGKFNKHTAHSFFMVTATSVIGEIKIPNIVPRPGIEPTSLAHCATITPPRLRVHLIRKPNGLAI